MKIIFLPLIYLFFYLNVFSQNSSTPEATNSNQNSVKEKNDTACEPIYVFVDQMPQPDGIKDSELINYLSKNLIYPDEALRQRKSGKVWINFVINKNGKIRDVKVRRSTDPIFNNEAIRVVSSMPNWIPGRQKGKTVCVSLQIPVSFNAPVTESEKIIIIGDTLTDAKVKYILINDTVKQNGVVLKMYSFDYRLLSSYDFITNEKQIEMTQVTKLIENGKLVLDGNCITYNNDHTIDTVTYVKGEKVKKQEKSEDIVYNYVDDMPEFPGGVNKLMDFLGKNTIYPVEAQKKGISGIVYVQFVVDTDGSIQRIKIVRGAHPLLDAEAIRVISIMPLWIPGKQNGEKVKTQMSVPIKFNLK